MVSFLEGDDPVSVRPDLHFAEGFSVIFPTSANRDAIEVTVAVKWDEASFRFRIVEVMYNRDVREGGLTPADIRSVPIVSLAENHIGWHVMIGGKPAYEVLPERKPVRFDSLPQEQQDLMCARKYALERVAGRAPLKVLAEWLDVSQSTAKRLAARLRVQGLID